MHQLIEGCKDTHRGVVNFVNRQGVGRANITNSFFQITLSVLCEFADVLNWKLKITKLQKHEITISHQNH